jgi:hypothetical protein
MQEYIKSFLSRFVRRLPVVGGLADCSAKDHLAAAKDLILALSFSTVAFWLSVIVLRALARNASKPISDILYSTIANGELIIFSVSFLGPVILVALADRQGKMQFPGRDWHIYAVWGIAITGGALFTLIKVVANLAPDFPGLTSSLDMATLVGISIWMSAFAVCIRYLSIVYQKSMLASDSLLQRKDQQFADDFAARRGK